MIKEQLCVYCGVLEADTRDHVIPKCLFPKPYPLDLITVPACQACNSEKSRDDSFLRDYLTVDFAGNESPSASQIFQGKVRRSVRRNSSEVGRAILDHVREEPLYTRGGIYLGNVMFAPLNESRIVGQFARIIRGLYFHYLGEVIPLSYPIEVGRIMPWDFDSVWDSFSRLKFSVCGPLGDVFVGGCARVQEEPLSTSWLLTFYGRVHFSVTALNPNLEAIVKSAVASRR